MPAADRKPLAAPLDAREPTSPHSIRFSDDEWDMYIRAAGRRAAGVTEYVRECARIGHHYLAVQDAMGKHGVTRPEPIEGGRVTARSTFLGATR